MSSLPHKNILVLIISSNNEPVYKDHKSVWKSYMNSNPSIDCYFIEFTGNNENDDREYPYLDKPNNTLFFKGEESFPNILNKTLGSYEFFLADLGGKHYDYIVRTNLSTVWDFSNLIQFTNSAPTTNLYTGTVGPYYNLTTYKFWFYFIGGFSILMSNDVCKLLLENRSMAESFKNMDDIDIGYTMYMLKIYPIPIYDVLVIDSISALEQHIDNIQSKKNMYYRCKNKDSERKDECECMKRILSMIGQN